MANSETPWPGVATIAGIWRGNVFYSHVLVNRWLASAAARALSQAASRQCFEVSDAMLAACRAAHLMSPPPRWEHAGS